MRSITEAEFSTLKKGDTFSYCAEGGFTVTKVYKNNGKTTKLTAKNSDGETLTFDPGDAFLIER